MDDIAPACAAGNLEHHKDRELIRRWQNHQDLAARNEVVKRYRPLAAKQAWLREGGDDLTHICLETITDALDTFDLARGTVFATHAVWQIRAALKKHFKRNRSVVTLDATYMRKWRAVPSDISLNSPNEDDRASGTVGDSLSDITAEDERGWEVVKRAFSALNVLTGRERDLFERRHLLEEGRQTFVTLSPEFNISPERLRQIDVVALGKVRAVFRPAWPPIYPPTPEGRPLSIVGHDAWHFLDERHWYLQKGIGHLRRRRDGHKYGPDPKLRWEWNYRRYPARHFSKNEIEEFVSTRPDLRSAPSNVIPFRQWQKPSCPIALEACA